MKVHKLKTWPEYFQQVIDGDKLYELRKNDRDYHIGDILHLQEWDPETEEYTGREYRVKVTSFWESRPCEKGLNCLAYGYCIMSIKPVY